LTNATANIKIIFLIGYVFDSQIYKLSWNQMLIYT
jgi:hypothetical protein